MAYFSSARGKDLPAQGSVSSENILHVICRRPQICAKRTAGGRSRDTLGTREAMRAQREGSTDGGESRLAGAHGRFPSRLKVEALDVLLGCVEEVSHVTIRRGGVRRQEGRFLFVTVNSCSVDHRTDSCENLMPAAVTESHTEEVTSETTPYVRMECRDTLK